MSKHGGKREGAGRPKGSTNNPLRGLLRDFALERFEDFMDAFDQMKGRDKIEVYFRLLDYTTGKLKASEEINEGNTQAFKTDWNSVAKPEIEE